MRLLRTLLLALVLLLPLGCGFPGAGPTTYYFSPDGSDSAAGTSSDAPLRSLSRVAGLDLGPGDRVLLRGGTTYDDPRGLLISSGGSSTRPVVLASYGGSRARIAGVDGSCVRVRADWVSVRGLDVADCDFAGIEVDGDQVRVSDIEASGSLAGVYVAPQASYTRISDSRIHDNTRVTASTPGADDDSGAFGVLVNGEHTEITGNTISGHAADSEDYGRDGAAVEVYAARETVVADNTGDRNQTFVEVGGVMDRQQSNGVELRGNRVTASASDTFFLVVHSGDQFGSASGVRLSDNTVRLTGERSVGIFCGPRCTPEVLALRGNTIAAAQRPIGVEGTYASRGDRLGLA